MLAFGKAKDALLWCTLMLLVSSATATDYYMPNKCGTTIDIESSGGILHSQAKTTYQNNVDCTLTLTANPERKILLTFSIVKIEGFRSCCNFDYLEIYDGPSTESSTLWKVCGTSAYNVVSSSNALTLRFRTDSMTYYLGFKLAYTSFTDGPYFCRTFKCNNGRCIDPSLKSNSYDNCGDNSDEKAGTDMSNNCGITKYIDGYGGTLVSQAGYSYHNNPDCTMTFTASPPRRILVTFDSVDIGNGFSTCPSMYDHLDIYDGPSTTSSRIVRICSSSASNVVSSSNSITLMFKISNSFSGHTGFALAYTSFIVNDDGQCSPTEFKCNNGRCIVLSLKSNSHDNCGDYSDEFNGINYMTNDCGRTIDIANTGGTLYSQLSPSYINNLDCTLTVTANVSRKILITFDSLTINGVQSYCPDDLQIFDGLVNPRNYWDTRIKTVCGSSGLVVVSSSNIIVLWLKTDYHGTEDGFTLAYTSFTDGDSCLDNEFRCSNGRCIDPSLKGNTHDNCGDYSDELASVSYMSRVCGRTISIGTSGGILYSQENPTYDNNVDCKLTLVTTPNRKILITFERVDFDGDRCTDSLQIYNGRWIQSNTHVQPICEQPDDYFLYSNSITIMFKTDNSETDDGFTLVYTSVTSYCDPGEFKCENGHCIDSSLKDNSHDNCGDNSDESKWSAGLIIGVTIACLVGLLLLLLFVGYVWKISRKPAKQTTLVSQPPQQHIATLSSYNHQQYAPYGESDAVYYNPSDAAYEDPQALAQPVAFSQPPPAYGQPEPANGIKS